MSERVEGSGTAFWGDADDTEALQRYRALVNAIDEGIYQLDTEGRFVAVNDGIVELTGYAREDLLGEHVSLLLNDDSSTPERLLTNLTDRNERLECTVQTAEGDQIRCDVWVTLLEVNGTVQGTVGIVHEITDCKRPDQPLDECDQQRTREPPTECERGLRETNARLEVAASTGLVGTWTWDIQETDVTADEYLAESHGMDPAEATAGVPIEEFLATVHEADQERVSNRLDEAVEEAGEFEAEYRVTNADGDTQWVVSRGKVEYDGNGEALRMNGATYDITERKEAEAELKRVTAEAEQQERLYETIISSTPDLIYAFDLDYRITFANDALLEMWGQCREESIGKTLRELGYEPWHAEMHEREIDEVIKTKEPIRGEVAFPHAEHGRRIYDYIFAPVLDGDGKVEAIVGTTRDVTERKQAEEALQESEERFRALITASSDVVYRMSPDWSEMHELEGKKFIADTDESTSDWLDKYIHPDDQPLVMEAIDEAIQTKSIFELEHRVEQVDGNMGWTFSRAVPMLDENGEIEEWIGMASDITDRKQREQALEKSERRYRTLAENFPNGAVGVYDHDLEYTLTEGAVLGETLPSTDRLEGNRMPELFPEETVEDLEPVFRAAVEDGETGKTTTEFGGRNWRVWAAPLRDADGDIFAGLSFAQDITERIERERELERALDLLERTERIADVGGWEIDVETQDVFWTDHTFDLLEVDSEEEPPLEEALAMYHDDDRPIVEDAVEEALDSGESFDVEVRVRTAASGELRWLRLQGVSETADGEVVSFRGATQDITDRKQREQRLEELVEKLEESNQRLEQFAYAASHDLQEPLRMVSSYLQLIERRYADTFDEDGREFLEFAVDGADRMREMIEGLLEYSRVETRGDPFEPVDLDAVFADVRQDLAVKIEETDAEVSAEDLPQVYGDGSQLNQVFQNLLDNAIEYSDDEPPRVHVDADQAGENDEWVISVSDEGIGIDPEDADRVFEVFQSLQGYDGGTGIGLALVERIVERHGGDIWVDSAPGEGATFSFTLPAEDAPSE